MNTQITSFRVTEKVTKSKGNYPDIPFLIVNITWQVPTNNFYFSRYLRDSKEIVEELQMLGEEMRIKPHKFSWKDSMRPVDVNLSFFTEVHKGNDFEDVKEMLRDF